MELYFLGLFALVRDDGGQFVCQGQLGLMVVILGLTVLFQCFLQKSFHPLSRQMPLLAPEIQNVSRSTDPIGDKVVPEEHQRCEIEFIDDSLKVREPILWVPDDPNRSSSAELSGIKDKIKMIIITNEEAKVTETGTIITTGIPSCMNNQKL